MSHQSNKSIFTLAIGATALASTMALSTASANPFEMNQLTSGYQIGLQGEMGAKGSEGKCGEGKCGEGRCGGAKPDESKDSEGKCGEGKCGGAKPDDGKNTEGKCGEGKCGGNK